VIVWSVLHAVLALAMEERHDIRRTAERMAALSEEVLHQHGTNVHDRVRGS
jgi:hypothetical protein